MDAEDRYDDDDEESVTDEMFEGEVTLTLDELVGDVQYYRATTTYRGECLGEVLRRYRDFRALKARLEKDDMKAEFPGRFGGLSFGGDVAKKRTIGLSAWLREAARRSTGKDAATIRKFLGLRNDEEEKWEDDQETSNSFLTTRGSFFGGVLNGETNPRMGQHPEVILEDEKRPENDETSKDPRAVISQLKSDLEDKNHEAAMLRDALAGARECLRDGQDVLEKAKDEAKQQADALREELRELKDQALAQDQQFAQSTAVAAQKVETMERDHENALHYQEEKYDAKVKEMEDALHEKDDATKRTLEEASEQFDTELREKEAALVATTRKMEDVATMLASVIDAKGAFEASATALAVETEEALETARKDRSRALDAAANISAEKEALDEKRKNRIADLEKDLNRVRAEHETLTSKANHLDADLLALQATSERAALDASAREATLLAQLTDVTAERDHFASLPKKKNTSKKQSTPVASIADENSIIESPGFADNGGGGIASPMPTRTPKRRGFGLFGGCAGDCAT